MRLCGSLIIATRDCPSLAQNSQHATRCQRNLRRCVITTARNGLPCACCRHDRLLRLPPASYICFSTPRRTIENLPRMLKICLTHAALGLIGRAQLSAGLAIRAPAANSGRRSVARCPANGALRIAFVAKGLKRVRRFCATVPATHGQPGPMALVGSL